MMDSGKFPEVVPFSVKKENFDNFYHSFLVERDTNVEMDTTMGGIDIRELDNLQNDNPLDKRGSHNFLQMLAKTPVWVIAHCLDRTMSKNKKYQLHPCFFKELAEADDDAFLIKSILNPKYSDEVDEHNKHIPCGPKVNLMDSKYEVQKEKGGNDTVEMNQKRNEKAENKRIVTVMLYIPSIERFFCPLVKKQMPRLDAFSLVAGKFIQNHPYYKVFDPCMAASLQIVCDTGHPSTGGFLEEFTKVYQIQVSPRNGCMKTKEILTTHHWQDHDV